MIINSLKKTAFLLLICVALTGCQRKAGADINEEMDDYAEPGLRGELNIPEKESFDLERSMGKRYCLIQRILYYRRQTIWNRYDIKRFK